MIKIKTLDCVVATLQNTKTDRKSLVSDLSYRVFTYLRHRMFLMRPGYAAASDPSSLVLKKCQMCK